MGSRRYKNFTNGSSHFMNNEYGFVERVWNIIRRVAEVAEKQEGWPDQRVNEAPFEIRTVHLRSIYFAPFRPACVFAGMLRYCEPVWYEYLYFLPAKSSHRWRGRFYRWQCTYDIRCLIVSRGAGWAGLVTYQKMVWQQEAKNVIGFCFISQIPEIFFLGALAVGIELFANLTFARFGCFVILWANEVALVAVALKMKLEMSMYLTLELHIEVALLWNDWWFNFIFFLPSSFSFILAQCVLFILISCKSRVFRTFER